MMAKGDLKGQLLLKHERSSVTFWKLPVLHRLPGNLTALLQLRLKTITGVEKFPLLQIALLQSSTKIN